MSWSIGLVRSGVVAAATLVMREKNDEPAPRFDETPEAAPPADPPQTQTPVGATEADPDKG